MLFSGWVLEMTPRAVSPDGPLCLDLDARRREVSREPRPFRTGEPIGPFLHRLSWRDAAARMDRVPADGRPRPLHLGEAPDGQPVTTTVTARPLP